MARSFKRNPQLSAIAEPNVTPLIDLAFSLLIIFMITTPLLEQTIPLDLPTQSASQATPSPDMRFEHIYISRPGVYVWGEREMSQTEMNRALADLARQTEPPVLHIRADRTIPYQEVVTLLDLIGRTTLSRISLDTAIGN
jgi:biopolymer transport protein ExbD